MSEFAPLRNIRVIDFTMGWSGPLATRHLADLGAEVIKIEACKYPDWWRGWEHTRETIEAQEHEKSPAFNQVNRNKLGMAVDLTHAQGRELALKLVAEADAVIENQATGVMDKLGLSYEQLATVNSSIIMLSLPAFGAVGPWSGYRGYGSTVEHGAGLPHLTGDPDGPPTQTHVAYGDACGGINAASALLVALFHRKRTGVGQRVELSQTECITQLGIHGTIHQGLRGEAPLRTGRRHPSYVPHGCFACKETDTWLVIAVTEDAQWPKLCEVAGLAHLSADSTLTSAAGRRNREAELEQLISNWARQMSADQAMEQLQAAGVGAAAVRKATQLLGDSALNERGYWEDMPRAVVGTKPQPMGAYRINGRRPQLNHAAPLLGEHNRQVLRTVLRLSDGAIDELERAGVIGDTPIVAA
jgi:crotonobetainyl-CoA:carnitine CoA-transferase CaiB-like acyl-CoA transferase